MAPRRGSTGRAMLANDELGWMIFLNDLLTVQPHEPDVATVLRDTPILRLTSELVDLRMGYASLQLL